MGVQFTKDAERKRVADRATTWELHKGTNIVQALRKARDMGWKEKKVQVRLDKEDRQYYIEPYEEGCGCNGLLKYSDFFD